MTDKEPGIGTGTANPVALPQRVTASNVAVIAAQLREAAVGDAVRIDARNTTHLSALGAQLLLSTRKTMQDKGGAFSIDGLTERAKGHLAIMGLDTLTKTETET